MTGLLTLIAVGAIIGVLVWVFKAIEGLGVRKERLRQKEAETDALAKANDVLAERREPSDAAKRLRDGTF